MATASCTVCGGGPCCHDCCLLGCHDQHSRKLHNSVGVAGLAGWLRRACVADLHLQRVIHALHICILPCVCTLYKSHAQCYFFIGDFYAASSWCSCATVGARATLLLCTVSAMACPSPRLCAARVCNASSCRPLLLPLVCYSLGGGQALRRRVWLPCRSTCL